MGVLECLEHRLFDLFLLDVLVNVLCLIAGAAMKQAFGILPLVSAVVFGSSLASEAHRGFVPLFSHSEVDDLIRGELDKVSRCTPNLKSGTRAGCPGSNPRSKSQRSIAGGCRGVSPQRTSPSRRCLGSAEGTASRGHRCAALHNEVAFESDELVPGRLGYVALQQSLKREERRS